MVLSCGRPLWMAPVNEIISINNACHRLLYSKILFCQTRKRHPLFTLYYSVLAYRTIPLHYQICFTNKTTFEETRFYFNISTKHFKIMIEQIYETWIGDKIILYPVKQSLKLHFDSLQDDFSEHFFHAQITDIPISEDTIDHFQSMDIPRISKIHFLSTEYRYCHNIKDHFHI